MKKFATNHFTNLRLIWSVIALLVFGFIVVGVPNRYIQLTTISPDANTLVGQLQPEEALAFEKNGLPVPVFAAYLTGLNTFIGLVFALIGLIVAWLRAKDYEALLVSIVLISSAIIVAGTGTFQPQWRPVIAFVHAIFGASVVPAFYLFPDGQFVPRWTRWLTAIWLIYTVAWLIFPSLSPPFSFGRGLTGTELPRTLWLLLWICIGLASQIYRYIKVSSAIQRQQIKWVVFGYGMGLIGFATGIGLLTFSRLTPLSSPIIAVRLAGITMLLLGVLFIPLSIGISILRYRLFDVDIIINRTLVYGTLSAGIVLTYILLIGLLGALLNTHVSLAAALLTAALTVPFFQPLRLRLQRAVNLLTFGGRDAPTPRRENEELELESQVPLRQRRLELVHSIWFVLALLAAIVLIGAVPVYYSHVAHPIISDPYKLGQFNVPFQVLIGLSDLASSIISFALAILLFWRKPNDRLALFVSFFCVITAVASNNALDYFLTTYLGVPSTHQVYLDLQTPLWILLFCIFPNGHFVPRWTRWVFLFSILAAFSFLASPEWRVILGALGFPQFILVTYAQLYRYRRVSSTAERQQTKWVVFGVLVAMALSLIASLIYKKLSPPLINIIPLMLAIAILRSRLWDIDLIMNRTLVYGALTAGTIALYILLVGSLSLLSQTTGNLLISLLATGLIAFLFQPLRQWLQRRVNRLIYGERDDPIEALSSLGKQMEVALPPDQVLPMLVKTIAQTLRLPFVAITLKGQRLTAFGQQTENAVTFPLTFHGETTGELLAAPRSPGESFTPAELRLLQNLARQAGAAVRNAQLTTDLQRSRQTIVTAREEERHRLRRDLHDGIGPTMAGLTLKLDAARDLVSSGLESGEKENLEEALQLLGELKAQTQETVQNIRHIVHTLRPPSLDVLGLVPALQAHFGQVATPRSVNIQMTTAPQSFPRLSAAVEVAAYRIVLEAVTNVINHAQAEICEVFLSLENGNLKMEIKDNGIGLPEARNHGIGLNSMRERAEELGGRLEVSSSPQGTHVCAEIPTSPARSER